MGQEMIDRDRRNDRFPLLIVFGDVLFLLSIFDNTVRLSAVTVLSTRTDRCAGARQ